MCQSVLFSECDKQNRNALIHIKEVIWARVDLLESTYLIPAGTRSPTKPVRRRRVELTADPAPVLTC